jgi:hypothetical protein
MAAPSPHDPTPQQSLGAELLSAAAASEALAAALRD